MHLPASLKALPLLLLLSLSGLGGAAWCAEAPGGNAPVNVPNVGQAVEVLTGQMNVLTKAREAAGTPGGPVEVFFKRLRVEPSFRATVTAKAFSQANGKVLTVSLLLMRDDGREMLLDASEVSVNELKLAEHLQLGQTYHFPQVCVAAGVPMNPKADEPRAVEMPAPIAKLGKLPLPGLPILSEHLADAERSQNPHFLASTLRNLPPFRGVVMKKHSRKLPDGKVFVSLAFHRPDALPITIFEVGALPETERFVDFLKEGEPYDFPAILDKVEGVKFPPAASGADSAGGAAKHAAPRLPHSLFAPPPPIDSMEALAPEGTLPPLFTPEDPPFQPGTAEEKALDHYVGEWTAPVSESSSGKFQNVKPGPLRVWRRWTGDGKQIRMDGYYWHDLDASASEMASLGRDVRVGSVAVYQYDPATSRFVSASVRLGADGKLALKPVNTGLWDEASRTFTWTPVEPATTTIRTSFSEGGVMRTAIVEKDSAGAVLGEHVLRYQRERR